MKNLFYGVKLQTRFHHLFYKNYRRFGVRLGPSEKRLGAILSALGAILAKKLHGRAWKQHCPRARSAEAGGPSEGRGSIPKGIWLPVSRSKCSESWI